MLAAGAGAAGARSASSSEPAAAPAAATVGSRVVPVPAAVRAGGGTFRITRGTAVEVTRGSADAGRVAGYAAALLRPSTGYPLPVVPVPAGTRSGAAAAAPGAIVLALGDTDRGLGDEGYRLRTTPRAVTISARTAAGLFHGVQTLRQLLPARVESRTAVPGAAWTVPDADIRDVPRYAYRGAMLDVARHFLTVAQVERYIDELALYKVNTLHLHLTDDQGWRIAIGSRPRLALYGGSTGVGGGPGGSYTQDDYRRIVRYAASRFLTVVPEIDGPSHTNAALASYPELNCDGTAPPLYTGTKVGFSSLCVPKAETYAFLDAVIREVAALTPGPYLHIGGDEAHSTSAADYVTYMDKVQPIVTAQGKTVIGWHQLDSAHPVPGALVQYWGTAGNETAVVDAAKHGTRVIMSPANRAYLDMQYTSTTPLGQHWAGYVDVRTSYDWDPATFIAGLPAGAVAGVEAPLWTETIRTDADVDYMAFPRLPGIAELGWSPAAAHDWNAYRVRLAAQGPRWQELGIGFYRSPEVDWAAAGTDAP
ncbi:beta-N-acetylhexosaminidase [Actinacidiphila acidipaludis]|uniref:beta-N-acetylhexosaminidase n=1 Tax=Actinacidiphila acidipaludis TaxID=2873382 RepID=A0ABS7QCB4_9ACTN|nr:beta-N-acetylhexosaminidase [Streptomyces acidipaludis]MBY8880808.1 beta-N-acetylhexosaminidase [Streptomyces acidipaludis]